jgi:hypothetical protein
MNTPDSPVMPRARIFAVGDVRGGNMKRVAPAVGERSIAVAVVHQNASAVTQESNHDEICD